MREERTKREERGEWGWKRNLKGYNKYTKNALIKLKYGLDLLFAGEFFFYNATDWSVSCGGTM